MSDIAINPVTRRVQFTGNTGTGPFAFTFNVLNSSDIAVYKNTTLLTLTADYTVTIAANGTGSVTLQTGQAVISSDYVTIIGGRNLERTTDFVTAGDLLASSLNEQLDSNVIMSQQLDESFGRALSVSPGDVDVSMTLPAAASRANQVVAFTSTGAVTTTNLTDLPELTVDKLNVDNLTLDGNTISTTNSNGNLILTPNGTGDVVVSGDLVVNGTTTTIHSTVVDIADKNITIAYGSSDAAAANGAGITVDGADATMNYYSTPDGWEFNKAVTVGYTGSTPQDLGGVLNVYSSSSPGMVIKSSSTSVDPKIQFEYSSQIWTVGQDSSSDDFKIINGTNLNSSAEIHINTDGDVALGGVSHYSNYELSVPQRVAIRSGSAVAAIDFAGTTELVFDGNVGNTNSGFSKFRFASWEADKMVIDGNTLKVNALAKLSGSEVSISDNLKFGDDKKAVFGDSTDLSVYFDASANKSYISHTGSGSFPVLEFNTDGYDMRFLGGGYFMIRATPGADVKLYHAGSAKLTTSSSGVVITGSITADSFGGVLSIADGSSSAPSLTNTGNTNTGLFFPANNQVGISASASEIVNISTTGVKITPFSGTDALVLNNNDTSIGDNNAIARIIATADDPTADQEGAEILFLSAGAWSTDSYPTEIILRTDNGGSLTNRMVVGSTGIDVTGTVTSDDAVVAGSETSFQSRVSVTPADNQNRTLTITEQKLTFSAPSSFGTSYDTFISSAPSYLTFGTANAERLRIDSSGRVGIGVTAPDNMVNIQESALAGRGASNGNTSLTLEHATDTGIQFFSATQTQLRFGDAASTGAGSIIYEHGTDKLRLSTSELITFEDNGTERMRIDSSGNVGIGLSSSLSGLNINGSVRSQNSASNISYMGFTSYTGTTAAGAMYSYVGGDGRTTGYLNFSTNDTERMRIDSSGALLVGKTAQNSTTTGSQLNSDGLIIGTRSGYEALLLNRKTSQGSIATFQYENAAVGSIGVSGGNNLYISGQASNHSGITFGTDVLIPTRQGAATDNITDLGASGNRFKDLHLSGSIEIENGTGNVGVGKQALNSNTGSNNTAVGYQAGYTNTTGDLLVAVGGQSLYSNTTGERNTATGWYSLVLNTTGSYNTAFGNQALYANTTANENTALGYQAGYSNTTSSYSTFIGKAAGYSSTGAQNTYLGEQSGYYVTSGAKNTILGRYNGNQGGLDIRTSSNNIVLSDGDGTPRLHIDSSGETDFTGRLNVTVNQNSNFVAKFENNAGGGYGISSDNSAGNHIFFYRNGSGTGSITDNGTTIAFNTVSDYRLKENVVELTGATDRLKQLNPSRFNFIADADTTVDGFIAHEVQSVVPEAITGTHNEVDADGNPVYQSIDQSKLVPLLVATIKELEARITALENA